MPRCTSPTPPELPTLSVDSFLGELRIPGDSTFRAWIEEIKVEDKNTLMTRLLKRLSRGNRKRLGNDTGAIVWTDEMKADHAAYMKVSDQFKLQKSDFHAANKSLEIYRAGGIGTPSGQRRVLKQALQAAELWADTGVAACQARLDFMIKFRNVFDQESTTRHIKQAELSLLSSRTAKENAKEFQETLDKTRVNPGMNW